MDPVTQPQSRKSLLHAAVAEGVGNTFNSPEAWDVFSSSTTSDSEEGMRKVRADVLCVMQDQVRAHVDVWMRDNGIEQTLDVIDEFGAYLMEGAESSNLTAPCSALPRATLAQMKVDCKKERLDVLREQLREKEAEASKLDEELQQLLQETVSLSQSIETFGKTRRQTAQGFAA